MAFSQKWSLVAAFVSLLLLFLFAWTQDAARLGIVVPSLRHKKTDYSSLFVDYNASLQALQHMKVMTVETITYGLHDIAMLKDDKLLYIYIPKSGSSTMRATLQGNRVKLRNLNSSNYFTFSIIRNPRDRLVSAYATIISRDGIILKCQDDKNNSNVITYSSPPYPKSTRNTTEEELLQAWNDHFVESLQYWMSILKDKDIRSDDDCRWNEHVIPQVEFLRGYKLSHLGCIETMNTTYDIISSVTSTLNPLIPKNTYEHKGSMPKYKFQSLDLLPPDLIHLMDKVYAEDMALYQAVCKPSN